MENVSQKRKNTYAQIGVPIKTGQKYVILWFDLGIYIIRTRSEYDTHQNKIRNNVFVFVFMLMGMHHKTGHALEWQRILPEAVEMNSLQGKSFICNSSEHLR